MPQITVLVVGHNNREMLRLTVESFRRNNTQIRFLLWYWDNHSDDGAAEWAAENCDRLLKPNRALGHYHGQPLDLMVQEVETPYVLTLDNDVVSSGPVLLRMLEHLEATGAFVVSPPSRFAIGTVDHFGRHLQGQPRIDPCCSLFRTAELARITKHTSFVPYECTNLGKFYDTGGMVRAAAEGAGLRCDEADWIWQSVRHYGAMTWARNALPNSPNRAIYDERIQVVRDDLAQLDASLRRNRELVVARYRENVDWLQNLRDWRIRVYDKDDTGAPHPLPNVGREAHTYAYHVATRYDDLAEVTVFAQADPFPHVPDFLQQIEMPTAYFRRLGPNRMIAGPTGDACHTELPLSKLYRYLTNCEPPDRYVFAPGACFVVHRSLLQRYPQAWWQRLTDYLGAPETQAYSPWAMERLWATMLTAPGMPHFYPKIPGWFSAEGLYRDAVRRASDGAHFVECGAWVGRSASFMAVEILNSHKKIRFDVVDHFRGSDGPGDPTGVLARREPGGTVRAAFVRNMAPVAHAVRVVEKTSVEAAAEYPDKSLDFVMIDAAHDEDSVRADILAFLPKMKPGGWLIGDDYTYAHPGVKLAVDAIFGDSVDISHPPCWVVRIPG